MDNLSRNLGIMVSSFSKEVSYIPSGITLFSYYLFERKCFLSLVENYFYPEICLDSHIPVSWKGLSIYIWGLILIWLQERNYVHPTKIQILYLITIWVFYRNLTFHFSDNVLTLTFSPSNSGKNFVLYFPSSPICRIR